MSFCKLRDFLRIRSESTSIIRMRIWALADLHLSFGVENKSMDFFGPNWDRHAARIEQHWKEKISEDDLVLIPGDISWALKIEDAAIDLQWIHQLPGTKVMLKGNHDFWWGSLTKMAPFLPPSIHLIQNNAFHWQGVTIGGARLWDTREYSFGPFIDFKENSREKKKEIDLAEQEAVNEKLFERELQRLEMSLAQLDPHAAIRIAMTHYPPIGADLAPTKASQILEKHRINICAFGHLHNIKPHLQLFGQARGIRYELTSCDYLKFEPLQII